MKVNIYYGGRGLIDDPTLFVLEKMEKVLDELRVSVERYNLYEEKSNIMVLPKTLKDVDGVILAASRGVVWLWWIFAAVFRRLLALWGQGKNFPPLYAAGKLTATTYGMSEKQKYQSDPCLGNVRRSAGRWSVVLMWRITSSLRPMQN